ncbi:lysophospholipase L1-like esterase [Terriglobus roseus DSM 18391]|uniref:Lysophospholipase L1-like esterase n=1 Tax=Terriglobus roseus (strain DSM 18391 / NRRL B-41598 / KBS 63) TaxID=926566 RepID=I3ZD38_TERRK|nr:SGNH/GDSL hydrolase family protein [Terriglobus roseus]AFL87156.1 lysophospholipase L1-like esterase [Terriglobus roseus DSM 18391]
MRLAALLLALSLPAMAQDKWLGTWTSAAMPVSPSASQKMPIGKQDVTLRQLVHISQGGKRMRVTFTNEFGTTPLHIAAAHVAFLSAGSKILPQTDRTLTFAGKPDITIAPGQFAASDAVVETVPIFSDLVISTAIPQQDLPVLTGHALALQTTFIAAGDQTTALQFDPAAAVPPGVGPPDLTAPIQPPTGAKPIVQSEGRPATAAGDSPALLARTTSWYFLKNVEVDATKKSAAVVLLGDSITDGAQSTTETNRRYPDMLAPLIASNKKTKALSVLNAGISGNRVLHGNAGPSALDRFDRDVLQQPGARYVIVLEGINDIGNMHRAPADAITEQELTDAFTTMANRAHAKGLQFFVATILPYGGAKYDSADGELIRQHVNTFLRTSPLFDGVIDFEKTMQDPQHPDRLLPKYECGDHLHPNDAGYAAMAAAVDLKLFTRKHKK